MLTIQGDPQRFCDGVSRRNFLKIGSLAMGGLTLTDLLAAEARAGTKSSHKAVIMIYLPGGPPHQDMFDLKMDAPSDIRGDFKPIETKVKGIQISEQLPRIAGMFDKFAVIRSLVGARDEHANPICMSGYTLAERAANYPALGSMVSAALGRVQPNMPAFVDLIPKTQHKPYSIPASTGFLPRAHSAVKPDEEGMADMLLKDISLSRLRDRRRLLASLDRMRKAVDQSDMVQAADVATQQAFDVLTSGRLVEALDVSKEDPKTLALYGKGQDAVVGDAAPCKNEQFLAARRLVEAGVRCVTLAYGFWDFHGGNTANCKRYLPMLDQGVTALVQDIYDRGLDKDVSVIVWGEFGRTPKINKDAGRDHWPAVSTCLLAGGGMKLGQAIGTTTPDGGYADERPIHYRDVLATVLHQMDFDVRNDMVKDNIDRPRYLLDGHQPIDELI